MNRSLPYSSVLVVAACATSSTTRDVAPPLAIETTAYEAAARYELPTAPSADSQSLHNVFRLSPDIISGGEPENVEAFEELAEMGVRTILSVDGKSPDAATAAKHGMRYVHVPIRYNGITEDERLAIAKTFRELDGPFYVHCFHGKHRGPAAAAIGRVVRDGAPRDRAVAEMRQWCGTSQKYEGLYATIAVGEIPSADETARHGFDFPSEHRFTGLRQAMVEISRAWETVEQLSKRGWQPDPGHPDASARNEAAKLAEVFAQIESFDGADEEPEDFRGWLDDSERHSRELAALLGRLADGEAEANAPALHEVEQLKASCSACHGEYRN